MHRNDIGLSGRVNSSPKEHVKKTIGRIWYDRDPFQLGLGVSETWISALGHTPQGAICCVYVRPATASTYERELLKPVFRLYDIMLDRI